MPEGRTYFRFGGAAGNQPPTVSDQSFSIEEDAPNGTVVGTVVATDPDQGDTLAYAITAGNTDGAFAIDTATGEVTVANSAALDYETNPSFSLTVEVTDAGGLSDTATVTVNVIGSGQGTRPTVYDDSFGLDENAADGRPWR